MKPIKIANRDDLFEHHTCNDNAIIEFDKFAKLNKDESIRFCLKQLKQIIPPIDQDNCDFNWIRIQTSSSIAED